MPKNTRYEVEKRRARVARYVARNYTYDEIAEMEDISPSQVYKDFRKWREQRVNRLRIDHDAAFVETLNGYDEAIRRAWDELADKSSDTDRASLIREIGRMIEKKARLMGLIGGSDGTSRTNILAIIHPGAADEIKQLMSPDLAAEIEGQVMEGEFRELPMKADADPD